MTDETACDPSESPPGGDSEVTDPQSEAEDSDQQAGADPQPRLRVSGSAGDEVSYAPNIRLFAEQVADDERRRNDRLSYDVAVYVRTDDEEILGLCGDISDGGLFVTTRERLIQGTLVELELLAPDSDEEFVLEGEVRWTRDEWDIDSRVVPGFGVKFLDLTDDDRARLDKIIEAISAADDAKPPSA